MEEEQIRQVILENYFAKIVERKSLEEAIWESTFTRDAKRIRGDIVHVGRDTIKDYLAKLYEALATREHVINNLAVTVVGDKASATCEWSEEIVQDGESKRLTGYDTFGLRKENGLWKIKQVEIIPKGGYLSPLPKLEGSP